MSRIPRPVAFVLLAVATGCVHRPDSYRLLTQNRPPILVPPGVANPELARRTFVANIPPGLGPCTLDDTAIQLQLRKKDVRVTANRDALLKQQAGWLADWSIRVEAQGCVASGSGQELATLIAESVPLDPTAAFRLLNANNVVRGYVDLGPENRLEVHSPILRQGTSSAIPLFETSKASGTDSHIEVDLKLAPSVIGFETAWYTLQPNFRRAGCHFEPLSADRNIQGKVEQAPAPAIDYFQFPPEAAFFRLLYKSDSNGVTAIVAFAASREELDRRTKNRVSRSGWLRNIAGDLPNPAAQSGSQSVSGSEGKRRRGRHPSGRAGVSRHSGRWREESRLRFGATQGAQTLRQ